MSEDKTEVGRAAGTKSRLTEMERVRWEQVMYTMRQIGADCCPIPALPCVPGLTDEQRAAKLEWDIERWQSEGLRRLRDKAS